MTYVVGEPRIDVVGRARVEECPVDRIYEGARPLYSSSPSRCLAEPCRFDLPAVRTSWARSAWTPRWSRPIRSGRRRVRMTRWNAVVRSELAYAVPPHLDHAALAAAQVETLVTARGAVPGCTSATSSVRS